MNIVGKTFESKSALVEYLHKNKRDIIELKRAAFKMTDGAVVIPNAGDKIRKNVFKALSTSIANDTDEVIKRTIVGNTYNWMDSHDDVHLDGTFNKSIGERVGKIWHLHDHEYKITAKVGRPTMVYEKMVAWKDLGIDVEGVTTALMMDTDITKSMNPLIFSEYLGQKIDQHSVGMYYVKIDLAIEDPGYEIENKVWTENIEKLGNKERAEEKGYFWAVREAKLIEISAVLEGSNEVTPTIEAKDLEPLQDTHKTEPLKGTHNDGKAKSPTSFYF